MKRAESSNWEFPAEKRDQPLGSSDCIDDMISYLHKVMPGLETELPRIGYDLFMRHLRGCLPVYLESGNCIIWIEGEKGLYPILGDEECLTSERICVRDCFSDDIIYTTFKMYGMVKTAIHPALRRIQMNDMEPDELQILGLKRTVLYNPRGRAYRVVAYDSEVMGTSPSSLINPFWRCSVTPMFRDLVLSRKRSLARYMRLGVEHSRKLDALKAERVALTAPYTWVISSREPGPREMMQGLSLQD